MVPITPFPQKVTVWCAISSYGVLGPYFYEEYGQNVTLTGRRYHEMLQLSFIPDLFNFCWQHDLDPMKMWFQQDGARPHIVTSVRLYLQDPGRFGGRTIGQHLDHSWPARSPDLTVRDFFLWGYIKDEISKRGVLQDRCAEGRCEECCQQHGSTDVYSSMPCCCQASTYMLIRNGRHIEQTL